ncbi:MAG: RtcB family protein [Sphingomonas sp.]|nr:RtcB family protein [Sphingomonas sp.]MBW8844162.1 RtcB family protein [Burkholderiales bacterium]
MMACKTTLTAEDLPDNLGPLRAAIERAVPHGRQPGNRDPGAWQKPPGSVNTAWAQLEPEFTELCRDYPKLAKTNHIQHLGTLGSGNHFIEVCLDEAGAVWFMLHSGSRGVGNFIGTMFIELAKQDAMRHQANLPDRDLAYFEEGSRYFGDYVRAVGWAQKFAATNREVMMKRVIEAAKTVIHKNFQAHTEAVNCHHNYVQKETHFGQEVWLTRKGAVSAKAGQLGIIPGSMGARSYIVRGKGNADSFESCSHGAGRVMSRGDAKRQFTLADHRAATEGVECRKDKDVIDETPAASGLFTPRQWVAKAVRQGAIKAQRAARTRVRASAATPSGPWRTAFPSGCGQKARARRCNARRVSNPAPICALLAGFLATTRPTAVA